MNQSSAERLGKFRQTMEGPGLDAWIGRIVDPHLSEYVPEHWQSVAWLTGFTGSTARLCVTQGAAASSRRQPLLGAGRKASLDGAPFEVVSSVRPTPPRRRLAFAASHPRPRRPRPRTLERIGCAPHPHITRRLRT